MSDMKFEKPFTPRRLVEEGIMLNVPVYQRLFVWEADQIQNLLTDLADAYERSDGSYNIGIMSVWVNAKENHVLDVVDGQQRLTFLSLWAAWNVAKLPANSAAREWWHAFLFADKELRLRFAGRPGDEVAIRALADGKMPLSGAFRRFAETTDAFVSNRIAGQDEENPFNSEEFARYVYERCAFLVDELPNDYGPHELNLYFEKMNSTGRQLEPLDMVKGLYFSSDDFPRRWNEVFRTGGDCSQRTDQKVSIVDIIVGQAEANEGVDKGSPAAGRPGDPTAETWRLVSDEVLLLHALRLSSNEDVPFDKSRLLGTFSKHFNGKSEEEKKAFLEALRNYSLWMDRHVIRLAKDEKQGANRYVFADSDDDADGDSQSSQDEKDDKSIARSRSPRLRLFESMLFVSSPDSQDWILEAYLRTGRKDVNDDDMLKVLKKIDAEKHPFPTTADIWAYGRIDRYWFWKLDYLLWERHDEDKADPMFSELRKEGDDDAISKYVFRKDRSIEHLHPQNPPPECESHDWEEDRRDHANEIRDGFGNLAMISSSFNSAQGNDSISTKMGRIDDQVRERRLQSIKLLLMIRSVKSNPVGWSVEAAREHGKQMLEFLEKRTALDCHESEEFGGAKSSLSRMK